MENIMGSNKIKINLETTINKNVFTDKNDLMF